ncbi:MAG: DUF2029 domain-containing protein [Chloroflexi bacterium]|nr:DUF2029 domain-containing protein [Chloroflexota bacterium]
MNFSWMRVPIIALGPRGFIVACVGGLVLMLAFFNLINLILPTSNDVTLYFNYARRTLGGEIPFLDFRLEYPPFALVFFILPALLCYLFGGLDRDLYACLFHTQCFALEVATLWISYRLLRKIYPLARPAIFTPRLVWYTLGGLAISLYLLQRFDIGATFLTSLGLYWLYNHKPGWGGVALGLGAVTKLYPAIVLPFALLYFWHYRSDRRSTGRCLAGFSLAGVLTTVPFLLLNPEGFLAFLKYHIERGLEIETIFASLVALGHYLNLAPALAMNDHNSLGITSHWSASLATFSTLLMIGGLLVLIGVAWRATQPGNHLRADWLIQTTAIAILWFILTNKVLSPQYLIWMLSFVPFWKGNKQPLFLVALLISLLPFPFLVDGLCLLDWLPMTLLALRNGLLIIILFQLIPALELPKSSLKRAMRITQPA